ncbi:MAG: hypothetical protein JNL76_07575 [Alphaproteobacteria bacterium]|nr:hypothetical protein [Alphaproteobacteria bacterium]
MNTKKEPPSRASREVQDHFFLNLKSMLLDSLGRIPTALVVILLLSTTTAVLTAFALHLNKVSGESVEFMPLRLVPSENFTPVDSRKIQGNWVYQNTGYAMTFTIIGDRFEWILALGDLQEAQFFARGNYRIVGDVMVLGVRSDLGTPIDPSRPWMKYLPMPMKDLNTVVQFDLNQMVWDLPLSEQKRILGEVQQIFIGQGQDTAHFVWTKQ